MRITQLAVQLDEQASAGPEKRHQALVSEGETLAAVVF